MLLLQLKSAATDGDVVRLEKHLARTSPRDRDEENYTPLHYAAWAGATDLCRRLVEQKAEVDAVNHDGHTPLHLACRSGRLDTVKYLLQCGANIHALDKIRYTPLHMAAEANWGVTGWEGSGGKDNKNAEVCMVLLERGANPAAVDSFSRTPLEVATHNEEIKKLLKQAIQQRKRFQEEANRKSYLQSSSPGTGRSSSPTAPRESPDESKPPETWDRQDVSRWLEEHGLGQYAAIFGEKAINGKYLLHKLTEEKLALIVSDPFHRERIMDEIDTLRQWDNGESQAKRREAEARLRRTEEELERQKEEERREREERRQREMRSLKSTNSHKPARITFENNIDNDVRINWVDTSGESHLKRFLPPNETFTEDTFVGHVWQLIDDRTGNLLRAEIASSEPLWVVAMEEQVADELPTYDQAATKF